MMMMDDGWWRMEDGGWLKTACRPYVWLIFGNPRIHPRTLSLSITYLILHGLDDFWIFTAISDYAAFLGLAVILDLSCIFNSGATLCVAYIWLGSPFGFSNTFGFGGHFGFSGHFAFSQKFGFCNHFGFGVHFAFDSHFGFVDHFLFMQALRILLVFVLPNNKHDKNNIDGYYKNTPQQWQWQCWQQQWKLYWQRNTNKNI